MVNLIANLVASFLGFNIKFKKIGIDRVPGMSLILFLFCIGICLVPTYVGSTQKFSLIFSCAYAGALLIFRFIIFLIYLALENSTFISTIQDSNDNSQSELPNMEQVDPAILNRKDQLLNPVTRDAAIEALSIEEGIDPSEILAVISMLEDENAQQTPQQQKVTGKSDVRVVIYGTHIIPLTIDDKGLKYSFPYTYNLISVLLDAIIFFGDVFFICEFSHELNNNKGLKFWIGTILGMALHSCIRPSKFTISSISTPSNWNSSVKILGLCVLGGLEWVSYRFSNWKGIPEEFFIRALDLTINIPKLMSYIHFFIKHLILIFPIASGTGMFNTFPDVLGWFLEWVCSYGAGLFCSGSLFSQFLTLIIGSISVAQAFFILHTSKSDIFISLSIFITLVLSHIPLPPYYSKEVKNNPVSLPFKVAIHKLSITTKLNILFPLFGFIFSFCILSLNLKAKTGQLISMCILLSSEIVIQFFTRYSYYPPCFSFKAFDSVKLIKYARYVAHIAALCFGVGPTIQESKINNILKAFTLVISSNYSANNPLALTGAFYISRGILYNDLEKTYDIGLNFLIGLILAQKLTTIYSVFYHFNHVALTKAIFEDLTADRMDITDVFIYALVSRGYKILMNSIRLPVHVYSSITGNAPRSFNQIFDFFGAPSPSHAIIRWNEKIRIGKLKQSDFVINNQQIKWIFFQHFIKNHFFQYYLGAHFGEIVPGDIIVFASNSTMLFLLCESRCGVSFKFKSYHIPNILHYLHEQDFQYGGGFKAFLSSYLFNGDIYSNGFPLPYMDQTVIESGYYNIQPNTQKEVFLFAALCNELSQTSMFPPPEIMQNLSIDHENPNIIMLNNIYNTIKSHVGNINLDFDDIYAIYSEILSMNLSDNDILFGVSFSNWIFSFSSEIVRALQLYARAWTFGVVNLGVISDINTPVPDQTLLDLLYNLNNQVFIFDENEYHSLNEKYQDKLIVIFKIESEISMVKIDVVTQNYFVTKLNRTFSEQIYEFIFLAKYVFDTNFDNNVFCFQEGLKRTIFDENSLFNPCLTVF